jgi:dihydroorotate dehydrogenase
MNLQPHSWFPDCVRVYPKKGVVLNAAGLSGPGAEYLFSQGLWQKRTEPFLISFMAIGESRDERIMETQRFSELILRRFSEFSTQFGVELNISCPNTAHRLTELFGEVIDQLEGLAELNVPIVLKVDALALIEAVKRVADSGLCDAIAVSNSIPWGELPAKIDWEGIFGSMKSPLEHLGGGGLSGYPLLPIVSNWIAEARRRGVTIPIIGGGGILKKSDVDFLHRQGASAISIGSVALLRPWRVQGIIQHAKRVFGD